MKTWMIVLIVIGVVLTALIIALYFLGKKAQKKQQQQQEMLQANKQTVSMLIIDKKKMRLKDAGLPQMVLDQTPKLMRRTRLPIVKAKIGPQIMSLICDDKIFDSVPVKKEVKAVVSGIYVLSVRGLHGRQEAAPPDHHGVGQAVHKGHHGQLPPAPEAPGQGEELLQEQGQQEGDCKIRQHRTASFPSGSHRSARLATDTAA